MQLKKNTHFMFLDSLRGLAAVYVVFHHACMSLPKIEAELTFGEKLIRSFFSFGHYAVDIFIVLSGYCLMLPILKNGGNINTLSFLKRRAWRIVPTYYFSMAISLILIHTIIGDKTGTHWDLSIPVNCFDIFTHLLLIQDVFELSSAKINHAFWSIGVEWKIYFLFPFLIWGGKKIGSAYITFFTVIFSYILWFFLLQLKLLNPSPWGSSVYYIGLFSMGMLAAEIAEKPTISKNKNMPFIFAALTSAVLMVTIGNKYFPVPLQISSLFVGGWAAVLIVLLRNQWLPKPILVFFGFKPFVLLGAFGYSIYLIHAPITQIVYQYIIVPFKLSGIWRFNLMIFISVSISLIFSYIFYLFCEKPFHVISKRIE